MATDSYDQVRVWVGRCIGIALLVGMVLGGWRVANIRAEVRNQAALDRHMRDMGLAFKAYAAADDGWFPPCSAAPGVLFFDANAIFPVYLDDPSMVVSPRRPDARALIQRLGDGSDPAVVETVGAESFFYLGYVIPHADAARVFNDAYRAAVTDGASPWPEDLTTALPGGYDGPGADSVRRIPRPREGVLRDRVHPDEVEELPVAQSETPILLERPIAEGAAIRVLYMDGHLATAPFGQFPNTRAFLDGLESLRDLRPPTTE